MTPLNNVVYEVKIIQRDGMGQTKDDYHATVTRKTDGAQLIFISDWLWKLKFHTRRGSLERAFKRHDKRELKLGKSYHYER